MALLEICCYSMECALTAQQNGADRVELCAAPKEGLNAVVGCTEIRAPAVTIPVHPIIRPRGGDFATATVSLPPFLRMCARSAN